MKKFFKILVYLCQNQLIFFLEVTLANELFILCPEKCLLRKRDNCLIIADVHLGKSAHFRKAGIGVPSQIATEEIKKLIAVIEKYNAAKIIFLGDLFHSSYNKSVDLLQQIIDNEVHREFILVQGNHDIMRKELYEGIGISVVDFIEDNGILYTHDKVEKEGFYNIFGHIHPGVILVAKAQQSLRLPCFFINPEYAILPAFGLFTGLAIQQTTSLDQVYIIAENQVMKVD